MLTVTSRVAGVTDVQVVRDSVAALRETARQLGLAVVDPPLWVTHTDPAIVEVCLPLA